MVFNFFSTSVKEGGHLARLVHPRGRDARAPLFSALHHSKFLVRYSIFVFEGTHKGHPYNPQFFCLAPFLFSLITFLFRPYSSHLIVIMECGASVIFCPLAKAGIGSSSIFT